MAEATLRKWDAGHHTSPCNSQIACDACLKPVIGQSRASLQRRKQENNLSRTEVFLLEGKHCVRVCLLLYQ